MDTTVKMEEREEKMEVDFWQVDNGKEEIWSKLKAIEIFEVTNIVIMVYNC